MTVTVFGNRWDEVLRQDLESENFAQLRAFLKEEYASQTIFPPAEEVFSALKTTDYDKVKVLLLGQDPYHGAGQAHGFAFSVKKGVKTPPSLQNIYKELQTDLGCTIPAHGNLLEWAEQGVLMLNTVLTVREGQPNSHKGKGWEELTDSIIRHLDARESPVVFLLWGANAKTKLPLIHGMQHLVLAAPHPSPLSAWQGFFGCRHFSKANAFLQAAGQTPIDWQIHD